MYSNVSLKNDLIWWAPSDITYLHTHTTLELGNSIHTCDSINGL